MSTRAERYGRYWAVYEHDVLLCLTVYKKGAVALQDRLKHSSSPQNPNQPTTTDKERSE
jgi:hypothetical protein